jgi:hypothetical protein
MKNAKSAIALMLACVLALSANRVVARAAHAQAAAVNASSGKKYEIDVSAKKEWVDTDISVHGGAKSADLGDFRSRWASAWVC